jgi:hypothetical protein
MYSEQAGVEFEINAMTRHRNATSACAGILWIESFHRAHHEHNGFADQLVQRHAMATVEVSKYTAILMMPFGMFA